MISFRSGSCNAVSNVGASERIMTIWLVASLVEVGVMIGMDGGMGVVLECERRCRNSLDMLHSVMMSRLTVLGHSLLRCLWVGRVNGALVGKSFVAMLRPSAIRSCMASAAAMTCWRVLESVFGRSMRDFGSGMCSVVWRALRFCRMVEVCKFVFVFISSFHRVRRVCGIRTWNFMGCEDEWPGVGMWGGRVEVEYER